MLTSAASYGTLLGVQVFQAQQTFIGGIIAFRVLPRPQFSTLQTATFPVYFTLQSALPVVVALTSSKGAQLNGISGLLAPENRFGTLLPLATVAVAGLINQVILRPLTVRTMKERKHQETRDGKKSYDPAPHSKEMMALNKKFGRLHGLSSLVNMVSLAATIYYGAVLSKRLS
ncbi:DUF4149 domain-containing protein [Aspergillus thermomutatus]|uniref:TMEM205-like domain-containing protein n=1 Tax=Aspergillus thermomutatus TaxID=41047 RepID=A0A397I4H9_ASPTH|nr:uncharacterized protein CDV56_108993 [Aspergillus thermomutatus]RHZ68143.1 hypothetical protein CDV56_108993 [Aspergillus thermomutatus]